MEHEHRQRRLQKMGMMDDTSAPSTFVSNSPSYASSEVPTLDIADTFDDTALPTSEEPKKTKGEKDGEFARMDDYDTTGP
jgi:hypothetical protein